MKVTIEDAHILAKQLKEKSPKIQGIELFGSILKKGVGHDIDLILTVDDGLSREFWSTRSGLRSDLRVTGRQGWLLFRKVIKKLFPWLDEAFIWKQKQARQARASNLIGIDLALLGEKYRPGTNIDVWLLPSDWRVKHTLNKSALSRIVNLTDDQNTLLFLTRIAQSAAKIV